MELRRTLPQRVRMSLHLRRSAKELDEDRHLGAQDLGHDRSQDVVHRLERIPPRNVRLVAEGSDEDDGRVLRPRSFPDEGCRLEPVQNRHAHVEQDDGEVLREETPERLLPGAGLDDVDAEIEEDRLERDELVRAVVDDQDARRV